ncbi:MAG: phospho-N-acetylmuramoyl-pentapeptide-transferase [Verrucomicrobiales bacterium]
MMYYLHLLKDEVGLLNVFQYITLRLRRACLTAWVVAVLCGPRVIRRLISMKVGQPIRTAEEVHKLAELHGGKAGTPTMGGVLILGAVMLSTFLWARPDNPFVWVAAFVFGGLGLLGFADDYKKVKQKKSDGISARAKLAGQFGIALTVGIFLYFHPGTGGFIRQLWVPFLKEPLINDMGYFAIALFPLVIVGCSNAVNLTDGLDGLATGCTITVAITYALFSYLCGHAILSEKYLYLPSSQYAGELAIVCTALVGACMGFLWFNAHPAEVFMGDTGSLAIGGLLGTVALCCKQELLLVLVGGVFVMEAGSVILQVGSFKLRKKRIFKMSPIHHHFELMGWHESKVINRFWILSIIFALMGLATLKLR